MLESVDKNADTNERLLAVAAEAACPDLRIREVGVLGAGGRCTTRACALAPCAPRARRVCPNSESSCSTPCASSVRWWI